MAEEDEGSDLNLSDWDDVIGAEPENDFIKEEENSSVNTESDDEGWGDVIAIEVLEDHCNNLMKQMEVFRRRGILCDAVIAVDDRNLPVHKNVLSATCPFFKNIFARLANDPGDNKITLRNLTGEIMEDILHFAYTGEVCIHDGNVRQLLATANFLKLQSLKDMSIAYLQQKLSPASAVDILLLADKHNCETLLSSAEKLFSDRFSIVAKTDGFRKLPFEILHQFIQSDDLRVSKEEEVYEAVMLWVKSAIGDRREKENQLPNLLREVRLPLMSPSYLSNISIHPDPIIQRNQECHNIILEGKAYHDPNNVNQIDADNKFTRPRKFMGVVQGILCIGGWQEDEPKNDVSAYISSRNNWYPLNPLPEARYCHAIVACDGFVYVLGGRDKNVKLVSSVMRFDPLENKWQMVSPLPYPVTSLGVCAFEGQIFVVGGLTYRGSIEIVLRYSVRNNVWQRVGNLNYPRSATAVVADEKYMYAIGGMRKISVGSNGKWEYLNTMEIFIRDTNSWIYGKELLTKRAYASAVYLNERIYLIGGQAELFGVSKSMEIYNTRIPGWTSVAYFGVPRYLSGISSNDGKFYVVGGFTKKGEAVKTAESYDTIKNQWMKVTPLPNEVGAVQCCTLKLTLAVLPEMT